MTNFFRRIALKMGFKKPLVIAIDGPSASGKGTIAKKLAAEFDLPFLNTGALYRLVAYRAVLQQIDPSEINPYLNELTENISEEALENSALFDEEVGAVASLIAKNPALRSKLFLQQKNFITKGKKERGGAVLDGRDTTTVICPDADYKFFITASVETRAKRRFTQLQAKGENVSYEEILAQLTLRDKNDKTRKDSPLLIARDAIVIDNSNINAEETFAKALSFIKK